MEPIDRSSGALAAFVALVFALSPAVARAQTMTARGHGGGGASMNGTIFSVAQTGQLTTLYGFPNTSVALQRQLGVVTGSDGNLYGSAEFGGPSSSAPDRHVGHVHPRREL